MLESETGVDELFLTLLEEVVCRSPQSKLVLDEVAGTRAVLLVVVLGQSLQLFPRELELEARAEEDFEVLRVKLAGVEEEVEQDGPQQL